MVDIPIVSFTVLPTFQLSDLSFPKVGHSQSAVHYSRESVSFKDSEVLVSFDVVSLLPTNLVIEAA